MKTVARKLWVALSSKDARGPEIALAKLIVAALGLKLGINFVDYVK